MKSRNTPLNTPLVLLVYTLAMLANNTALASEPTEQAPGEPADQPVAYVDSIHKWGAWGLDIEPAAGGVTPPGTQPLSARQSKLQLRTNSFAGLGPQPIIISAAPTPGPSPGPTPAPPAPAPVTPAPTPISPSVPIPVGGPSDGF